MNGIGYKIKKTILYILLILLSVVCMFPFLLMIVNATRSGSEIMKSFTLIPSVYLKENWATVFKYFNLFLGMWNSLKVAVPSTLLCAYFSAMTAYALAMYKFKGNKVLFMTILIFMMIPGQLGLIGFYNLCTKLHLVNSYPQNRNPNHVTWDCNHEYHGIHRWMECLPVTYDYLK